MSNKTPEPVDSKYLIEQVIKFFSGNSKDTQLMERLKGNCGTFEDLKQLPFDAQQSKKSKFEPVVTTLFEGLGFYVKKRWWKNKVKKGDVDFVAFFKLHSKEVEAFAVEVSTSAGDS